jgi:hypothetical protein
MDARYTHMLDHSYLDDARALNEYLRRADSPSRIEQLATAVANSSSGEAAGARTGAHVAETA